MTRIKQQILRRINFAKFSLLLATVLALFLYPYIPSKTLVVYPDENNIFWGAYSDIYMGGDTSVDYNNDLQSAIRCKMGGAGSFNMCGNTAVFEDNNIYTYQSLTADYQFAVSVSDLISRDFSQYSGIWLELDYQGPAKYIHVLLKNHEPNLEMSGPERQFRPQSVGVETSELFQPVYLRLQDFKVSDWWVNQFALHRTESGTRFDRIQAIGVEVKEQPVGSEHYIEVNSIILKGDWIKKETFYLSIILVFVTLIGIEGGIRIYSLYVNHRIAQKSLRSINERNQQLESVAFKDELTQLLNRRAVYEIIKSSINLNREGFAILVIDIDHFKQFNDTYGHAVGDKVLVSVAKVLRDASRSYDNIARWGGEEFVIVSPGNEPEKLLNYAEKLRTAVAEMPIETTDNKEPIFVTISIGVTLLIEDESFESAFERADQALYDSKRKGRNCCTFS